MWLLPVLLSFSSINGLLLHTGKVTALQLSLKLGEHHYEAGTVLMSAIDTEKCFDSFAHLLTVETLSFKSYYQDTCGSANVSARIFINTVWRQARHRGLDVGKLVGIECLANIYKFGMHMDTNSHFWSFQSDSLLTSRIRLDYFTLEQIQALVKQVAEPTDEINPLTTAYLCPEIENHHSKIMWDTRILDGPFIDSCPMLGPLLVGRIPTVSGVDLSLTDRLSDRKKATLVSHLSSKFGILDVVGKYLQLGSLAVFASPTSQVYRNRHQFTPAPVMQSLKSAIYDLNRVNKHLDPSRPGDNLILSIARELANTMINSSSHAFDLMKLLKSLGTTDTFEFYNHIMNFLEGIFDCEAQMNIPNMLKIVQVRVDALVMLSQYSPDPENLEQAIKELLADDRPSDMPFFRVPCRALLTLLWTLSKDVRIDYTRSCELLMKHISENMSHGSSLGVLRWFQVDKYLPWYWKAQLNRIQINRSTSELDFPKPMAYEHLGKIVRLGAHTYESIEDPGLNFEKGNGYMDIYGQRRAIVDLIMSILEHHFVYVGHYKTSGKPSYIQSLTCHPFIHDLLMRLIMKANVLRIYLPFELHPMMATLMMDPGDSKLSSFYVNTVLFAEFQPVAVDEATKRSKLLMASSLIDHLMHVKNSKKKQRSLEEQYISWISNYRRPSKSVKSIDQLDQELRTKLTPEMMNNFTRLTFRDFEVNQFSGATISQAEGLSLLFNHAPN